MVSAAQRVARKPTAAATSGTSYAMGSPVLRDVWVDPVNGSDAAGDGSIRAVVPRAIECPTVEQFVAGLVISSARNNLRQPSAGWYRTALSFAWSR